MGVKRGCSLVWGLSRGHRLKVEYNALRTLASSHFLSYKFPVLDLSLVDEEPDEGCLKNM
jgi:hypothetical protein